MPGTSPSGASRGRGRAFFHAGARAERRARGQARSSLHRQVSPDRAVLSARRGGRFPRDRCRSRIDASGSLGAERDRPRCGEPAPAGVLPAASRWRRRPQHPSPRGGQQSRLTNYQSADNLLEGTDGDRTGARARVGTPGSARRFYAGRGSSIADSSRATAIMVPWIRCGSTNGCGQHACSRRAARRPGPSLGGGCT